MATKAERHAKRASVYKGYKPKSKTFYVVVTTPPRGAKVLGKYSSHTEAAKARAQIARSLSEGTAHVKGEATLRRSGLL